MSRTTIVNDKPSGRYGTGQVPMALSRWTSWGTTPRRRRTSPRHIRGSPARERRPGEHHCPDVCIPYTRLAPELTGPAASPRDDEHADQPVDSRHARQAQTHDHRHAIFPGSATPPLPRENQRYPTSLGRSPALNGESRGDAAPPAGTASERAETRQRLGIPFAGETTRARASAMATKEKWRLASSCDCASVCGRRKARGATRQPPARRGAAGPQPRSPTSTYSRSNAPVYS